MKTLHLSIIAIVISFGTYYAFAQYPAIPYSGPPNDLGDGNFLVMQTAKGSYLGGDLIEITGNAPLKSYVKIILTDPNGTTSDSTTTFSDRNGYFTAQLKMPKDAFGGIWKIVGTSGIYQRELDIDVFAPDAVHTTHCCMRTNYTNPVVLDSPLKQFKSGIVANNVKCQQDLQLVIKSEDGSPACVASYNINKLIERGWAKQELYYIDPHMNPKVTLYDYSYDGIDKDNATVSINNQTYYQTTPSYSVYNLKGVSIQFQNVTFAFPQGTMITPGGGLVILDVKFHDGSEEIYGENKKNSDGSGGSIGGIPVPTQYGPSSAKNSITVLSNHLNPQAGLTIYNDKIKLLVSTDNQASSALKLFMSANSDIITPGKSIGITISVNNTLGVHKLQK